MKKLLALILFVLPLLAPKMDAQTPPPPPPAVASLSAVHTIYIAPMAANFDQYLMGEIMKRMPKGLSITQNKNNADAILEGVAQQSGSGVGRDVNQVLGGGGSSGAVRLVSSNGTILWSTERSDHTIPLYSEFREHGLPKVAGRISKDLIAAWVKAQGS